MRTRSPARSSPPRWSTLSRTPWSGLDEQMEAGRGDGRQTIDRPSPPTHLRRDERWAGVAGQGRQDLVQRGPCRGLGPGKCACSRRRASDRHRPPRSAGAAAHHRWRARRRDTGSDRPVQWSIRWVGRSSTTAERTAVPVIPWGISSKPTKPRPPLLPSGAFWRTRPHCCRPLGSSPSDDWAPRTRTLRGRPFSYLPGTSIPGCLAGTGQIVPDWLDPSRNGLVI